MNQPPTVSATCRVTCPAGEVIASVDGAVIRARGIRYARADRFAPPVAEAPADATIDARHPSPACIQPTDELGILRVDGLAGLEQSEDCLRVTVTVPATAIRDGAVQTAGIPVLVWIHGGAYRNGAADSALYDPAALVDEQQVIVVSVGYRLGVLGFPTGQGHPANLGLLDVREALHWVQRNIASFGGDPGQVTIFGESAGADAIAHLMISPGVISPDRQLFHRAILQSAPLGTSRGRNRLVEAQTRATAGIPLLGPLSDLAATDAAVLASGARAGLAGRMPYGIQYGHDPLPAEAAAPDAWRAVAPYVDILAGTNTREVALYQDAPPFPAIRRVRTVGPVITESAVNLLTRTVFERPTAAFVQRHQRAGGRARRYLFGWGAPGNRLKGAHAAELPFLFSGPAWAPSALLDGTTLDAVHQLGRGMRQMWADFARTGVADARPAAPLLELVD